tara:strand:+ start:72 stop:482 length:411 start_codon:yes stop_codon:yes gene_type:complete
MATTIASIDITSTDLLSDKLSLSAVTTLTNAGSATGVTQTTGLARKKSEATDLYILYDRSALSMPAASAHKVYIKNLSTTAAEFVTITIAGEELGRLYAGDWCFFPWSAHDDANDISITPSVSSALTIEHMLFFES